MGNTVRNKRGSGSDPSASDLVLGEIAVRTDTGQLFVKKDNGSVASIAGGISDGDKGDITVSSGGATFTIDSNAVTTAKISDNNVTLAKLENIATSRILGRVTSGTGDPETLTAAQVRTLINVENGATADQTASEIRALVESASDSNVFTDADHSKLNGIASGATNVTNTNQLTNGAGFLTSVSSTGNLANDVVTFGKIQNISAGRMLGNLTGGVGDMAELTAANVRSFINVADGATNVTNTNQLTNGAGFLTSVGTSNIADDAVTFAKMQNTANGARLLGKISSGGGQIQEQTAAEVRTFLNVENGATADQSASEILTLIKTVDGAGSGLDADTLDGISSGSFVRSDADDTMAANLTVDNGTSTTLSVKCDNSGLALIRANGDSQGTGAVEVGQSNSYGGGIAYNGDGSPSFAGGESADHIIFYRLDNGTRTEVFHYPYNSNTVNFNSTPTVGGVSLVRTNDTIAQATNASTLDSIDSSQFARSDTDDTLAGIYTLTNTNRDCLNFSGGASDDNRGIAFNGRIALSADQSDGWLRLNNASEFGSGVYTPGIIRADSGFRVGGTTVINSSGNVVASRISGALPAIDGSALTGISAGATGGGSDEVFYENGQTVTTNYTITNGKNAMAAGPITINSGVTVTVGSGETLTIV